MTQTLTTEQLRARAKFWREKAVEAKWESVSIAQDMLLNADAFEELAANREAQPVGVTQFTPVADLYAVRIFSNASMYTRDAAEALRISKRNDNSEIVEYVHIKRLQDVFTAPPAHAVNPELTRAPVVPPEADGHSARMAVGLNRYTQSAYIDGWNACRAAMLAAVPEGGN